MKNLPPGPSSQPGNVDSVPTPLTFSDKRRCVLCERVFKIAISRTLENPSGQTRETCPTVGCQSTPEMWVHPGDPLTSEEAWQDWERMTALWVRRLQDESDLAA